MALPSDPPVTSNYLVVEDGNGNPWAEIPEDWIAWFLELQSFFAVEMVDLTDGGDSTLHYHAADRVDANQTFTDVVTNDASTTKHGFMLKATAPASGIRNVVAIDNGETGYKNTALVDNTAPADLAAAASAGTSLIAARRDHVHIGLTPAQLTDLTDEGVTTLHGHETTMVEYPAALTIGTPTHIDNLQHILDHSWSSGIVDGCAITDNGDGTISIAEGNATIRSAADAHSNLYNVKVDQQLNIALTNDATNYVYYDYNAGVPQFNVSTSIAAFNGLDKVIAWVVHRDGTLLHWIDGRGINVDNAAKSAHMFLDFARFIHAADGTRLGNPSSLYVSLSSGHFYFMLNEISHIAFDTSVAGTANANVFTLWNHTIAGAWTSTADQKLVGTTQYDTLTGPTTLGNNKYGVTWFYLVNDSPSELHAVMGIVEYPNAASAVVATPPASLPTLLSGLAVLVGFVTYEKSAIAFTDVKSAFSTTFGSSAAVSHNGLAGIQGGATNDYFHLTSAQNTDLTDGGESSLHYHLSDRIHARNCAALRA